MREGYGHRGKYGHREHCDQRENGQLHQKSAQTFRRGRAVAFLDKLMVNRSTLQRQLNDPELEAIKLVISGELKATETIIDEFIQMFQLHLIPSDDNPTDDNPSADNLTV